MSRIVTKMADGGDSKKWNNFANLSNGSTLYHLYEWKKIINDSYGHNPIYLISQKGKEVVGIYPLFIMKNPILGKRMVSLPFCSIGGPLYQTMEISDELIAQLYHYMEIEKCKSFEIRLLNKLPFGLPNNRDNYFTLVLELNSNPESIWKYKLNKKVRNSTRKAKKMNVRYSSGKQYIKDFYYLYVQNMMRLGTPHHSFNFFLNVIKNLSKYVTVDVAKVEDNVVAAMITSRFKDTVTSIWAASDYRRINYNPNNLLYWEVIKKSCVDGYRFFDFSRSIRNSGTYNFKKHWGAEPIKLNYCYSDNNFFSTSQDDSKRMLFSQIWSRLPNFVALNVGPLLRRNIP